MLIFNLYWPQVEAIWSYICFAVQLHHLIRKLKFSSSPCICSTVLFCNSLSSQSLLVCLSVFPHNLLSYSLSSFPKDFLPSSTCSPVHSEILTLDSTLGVNNALFIVNPVKPGVILCACCFNKLKISHFIIESVNSFCLLSAAHDGCMLGWPTCALFHTYCVLSKGMAASNATAIVYKTCFQCKKTPTNMWHKGPHSTCVNR